MAHKAGQNEWKWIGNGQIKMRLTQGKVALLNESDLPKVSPYRWCAHYERGRWYAITTITIGPYETKGLRMHRLIMDAPDGMDVDHINRNGLDNRRENMRLATRSQNLANCRRRKSKRQYKGVYSPKHTRKWRARIRVQGRTIHLGYFDTEAAAARAYNCAAREHFGKFARANQIAS